MNAGNSNIMSKKELEFFGNPQQVNDRLKMILSRFSKQQSDVYQILQGQARSTGELLDLLESSINLSVEEIKRMAKEGRKLSKDMETLAQGVLI